MIIQKRHFEKKPPSRSDSLILIFCEGACDEKNYFNVFAGRCSNIRIEIEERKEHENQRPLALYKKACELIIKSGENTSPKYELNERDEVWFVIDTDLHAEEIPEVRELCSHQQNWAVVQSNPCFELWKYYHVYSEKPNFPGMEQTPGWKNFLHTSIAGGFDFRKHTYLVETAIKNSRQNFSQTANASDFLCTEVHLLAERIFPFIREEIRKFMSEL